MEKLPKGFTSLTVKTTIAHIIKILEYHTQTVQIEHMLQGLKNHRAEILKYMVGQMATVKKMQNFWLRIGLLDV
jgi:hypothetical protein